MQPLSLVSSYKSMKVSSSLKQLTFVSAHTNHSSPATRARTHEVIILNYRIQGKIPGAMDPPVQSSYFM